MSPFKASNSDEKYVEEILITAGDDVNQVTHTKMIRCVYAYVYVCVIVQEWHAI